MNSAAPSARIALRLGGLVLALVATMPLSRICLAADATSPDMSEDVATAAWWGDFDELERLYAKARSNTTPMPTGEAQIEGFRRGFARIFRVGNSKTRNEAYFSQLDALTRQWATAHPESSLAQAAYARALYAHAWFERGDGFADTVTPPAREEFQRYLRMAAEHLSKTASIAMSDPTSHLYLVMIARSSGQSFETQWAIMQDALSKSPQEEGVYWELVFSAHPKWGGNATQLERIAREAAAHAPQGRSNEMYARVYMTAGVEYGGALFTDTKADWAKIKPGLLDMVSRFPSPVNLNRTGYIACLAQDKQVTAEFVDRIGDQPLPEQWYSTYSSCKRWSHGS